MLTDCEDAVRDVLIYLLDEVLREQEDYNILEVTLKDVRKAKSIASVDSSDIGDSSLLTSEEETDIELLDKIESTEDSDNEFEQYLHRSKARRHKNYVKEHCWHLETKKSKIERERENDVDEYSALPDFSKLSIHCSRKQGFYQLGVLENIVGSVALLRPTCKMDQILNLDTILFDKNNEAIGVICDIVGTVKAPLYCFKLDSTNDSLEIGSKLFYIPNAEDYTKKLIDINLETAWEGDISDEDAVFSNDEDEARYLAMKQTKKTALNTRNQQNITDRKRNQSRVQFQQPDRQPYDQTHHGVSNRSRGRGRGSNNHWQSRGRPGRGRGYSYSNYHHPENNWQPHNNLQQFERSNPPAMPTESNPYAEFGCYDNFSTKEVSRDVYKRM